MLMNAVRNSGPQHIDSASFRFPKLMAVFLGEALQVLMNPQHILYEKVNTFFLQRPVLDLQDIPMFYTLSISGDSFEQEVEWLLDVLITGLDDELVPPRMNLILMIEYHGSSTTTCNGILFRIIPRKNRKASISKVSTFKKTAISHDENGENGISQERPYYRVRSRSLASTRIGL
jgi:Nucleolar pre-ribosomal-associated protein 1